MNNKMFDVLLNESALGVKEIPGAEANPRIMEYLDTTTIRATDDITPWCSACINWVAIEAGYAGTDSAASATWRNWGEKLNKPKRGCVIGFVRKDGSGHVGLYVSEDDTTYTILGGNQADTIKMSRFSKEKSGEPRDWYFRSPKGMTNSKSWWTGAAGVATVGTQVPYEEVLGTIVESKERVEKVAYELTPIVEESFLASLNEWTPILVIGMFAFMMWDRRRHWKSDGK